jgi:hypothetical protein
MHSKVGGVARVRLFEVYCSVSIEPHKRGRESFLEIRLSFVPHYRPKKTPDPFSADL